ncbi:MAG: ABC transporter permease [Boseongicola sp. SB0676_bin_33]|uniref:ABC transporter permease n=1 Tax=Boseongicola sp. SB0664_bin_43 TaxID=2604844 RepID=A0A6B0XZQ4_9RHOB|nr:ABC transporter permease [Boseongicola sp. SB0664_bin_43]MYF89922.1 ABC transporter permease [Boseongicola sp. SB0676_bin_33]MYK32678.1 ABC transporter permease [Boseongicola sp. SB0670_bin_30]
MKRAARSLGLAGTIGLTVIVAVTLAAVFAPAVAPFADQGAGAPNIADRFHEPSAVYWLGTDSLGRDILSRVIYGGRVSIAIGLAVVFIGLLVGLPIGIVAGYKGGWVDETLMRVTDVFLAFPALLLAVLMAAALGAGLVNCIIAISVSWWPWYARLARSEVLVLRSQPYVEAAQVMGVSHARILVRHVLPAVSRPLSVQAALDFGPALLTGSALSFLGLGVRPPVADWGEMVNAGRAVFPDRWWVAVAPGVAIFLMALAFSLLGDALRSSEKRRGSD